MSGNTYYEFAALLFAHRDAADYAAGIICQDAAQEIA